MCHTYSLSDSEEEVSNNEESVHQKARETQAISVAHLASDQLSSHCG